VPHTGEVFIVQPLYSSKVRDASTDPLCAPTIPRSPEEGWCSYNHLDTHPPYTVGVMDKSLFYNPYTQDVTRAFDGPPRPYSGYHTSQPTTAVMLPLLHDEKYQPRVLVCGAEKALIADLAPMGGAALQWTPTAPRLLMDRGVYSTYWDANGGWLHSWFRLDGFGMPPGAPVSSLLRSPDHIDLFAVGLDGGVYSTYWDANGGWLHSWFRI